MTALIFERMEQCQRTTGGVPRPRYPFEFREGAVRMVFEHQDEYLSQWKAIESIAKKLQVNHETLRHWCGAPRLTRASGPA